MSGEGSVTRTWGDGEHTFRLRIKELRELEEKRDAGSMRIYLRLASPDWRTDDVIEVLRLGLIGGGLDPHRALGLVAKYAKETMFLHNVPIAIDVIQCAIFGDPKDAVGKVLAETGAAMSHQDEPGSRPSSELVPQWDGASTTSTDAHSGNSQPPSTDGRAAMAAAKNGRNP